MAKRKRLTPAIAVPQDPPAQKTSVSEPSSGPFSAPPIAQVSAEASATAALSELSDMVTGARAEGRMLERLPLSKIDPNYLIRDRIGVDEEDLSALMASLKARGQTTPIEVTPLPDGRYGLISGWRRMMALGRMEAKDVLARIVTPDTATAAYVAMVEENEIRVNLTPYERAHIVVRALEENLFASDREALQTLYANVSRSKRSKIGSFVRVVRELGAHLTFPRELSERQGLALAKVLGSDPQGGSRLRKALAGKTPQDAEAEAALLARALAPPKADKVPMPPAAAPVPASPRDYAVTYRKGAGKIVITGGLVDDDLNAALEAFLARRAQI